MTIVFDFILGLIILWAVTYMIIENETEEYSYNYAMHKKYVKLYAKHLKTYPSDNHSVLLKEYLLKVLEYYNKLNKKGVK